MNYIIVCLIMLMSGIVCAHFDIMYYQIRYYIITIPIFIVSMLISPFIATWIRFILHL